ncbi:TolC family protein [Methylophaga thalassica]|uniref:TolC family protein n=1 Tax=Methylophaga aminisulfidivorans TaxID=230105 RepID=UPI0024E2171C|nr:TolC family protein [Methylophaga aminisulfidivorans]
MKLACVRQSKVITLLSTTLLLSACISMPASPDYTQQIEQQQALPAWSQSADAIAVVSLNSLIDSEQLNQLVETAVANNPTLQQTWLTLQIRQTQLQQTDAARKPQVSADASATRSENASDSFTSNIDISWQADLWGKLKNNSQAASKDVIEQALLYQAARDSLSAEVMKAWLNLTATSHAIDIEQQRLNTLEQNETYILQRYRNGIGTLEDLDNARSASAQSRASLASYQEDYRQQQRDLKQLVGLSNAQDVAAPESYPQVKLALADLPQQTLARRPDLQAAYAAIEANQLRTKVAYKQLLPNLDLGAAIKDAASSPHQALMTSPLWSLLAQLTAPIYQGGELRAAAKEAELNEAYSYQSYRETLLTAINEVERYLSLEQNLMTRQQHISAALKSAQNSLKQYQTSYRTGLVDILDLLTVQQQTYNLEASLDNLIYQRLINRINLGLALGLGTAS